MKGITAITLTGDRPLTFALCERWMERQTLQPDQWIVVDDGRLPIDPTMAMNYIRREPRPDDPRHTMLLNLREAIPRITGEKIIIIEDDEYYAPEYIEEMVKRLDEHEVVGMCRTRYYHFSTGHWSRCTNMDHASFAQTAFRASFLPDLMALMEGNVFIDMRIWKLVGRTRKLRMNEPECKALDRIVGNGRGYLFDDDGRQLYVAMKAMPGRPGLSSGHTLQKDFKEYRPDSASRDVLRGWTGGGFPFYEAIMERRLMRPVPDPHHGMREGRP